MTNVIDHIPSNDETRPTMRAAYSRTLSAYSRCFGAPDPSVWTDIVATCGDSYSGFIPPSDEVKNEVMDPFSSDTVET